MELVLQQRQELNLLMTMELRQAIELLQYSTYELEQYIRQQELENPIIELKEVTDDSAFQERISYNKGSFSSSEETPLLALKEQEQNMRDALFEQVKLTFKNEKIEQRLHEIIYNLDDNGYLAMEMNELSFSPEEVENGIELLQQVGPLGIGARSLKECLLLQIRHATVRNELAESLVDRYLHLLADRKWNDISTAMNIPLATVKELYDYILTLNPRPCLFISDSTTEYVTPDIIVEEEKGKFVFHLNDKYLPKIQLNEQYTGLLKNHGETSKYMQQQFKNYKWLLSSIEQRRNTIIKIVNVLLEKQLDFFHKGFAALQPLTLKDVADAIEMHESTVSRATANKTIQTPLGSFELRSLFTSKLETANGDAVSQTKVKALLQAFIAKEDKRKPYSDQKIAEYFNGEQGISISRRTISKYREELRIPSSSKRKEIRL